MNAVIEILRHGRTDRHRYNLYYKLASTHMSPRAMYYKGKEIKLKPFERHRYRN